jgi:hypothetical protein
MLKYAIALAIVLIVAAFFAWAFLPARHLPGNRARHLRIRLHLRLHPGKTSDGVKLSSCSARLFGGGGECGGFVVVLAGDQAVVQAAEQAAEEVALGGGVPVAGVFAPVVVGAGAG